MQRHLVFLHSRSRFVACSPPTTAAASLVTVNLSPSPLSVSPVCSVGSRPRLLLRGGAVNSTTHRDQPFSLSLPILTSSRHCLLSFPPSSSVLSSKYLLVKASGSSMCTVYTSNIPAIPAAVRLMALVGLAVCSAARGVFEASDA